MSLRGSEQGIAAAAANDTGATAAASASKYGPGGTPLKSLANLSKHSWNVYRYIADYLHLFGVFVLLARLARTRSCAGISRSTQIIYFTVFIFRYLDLVDHSQTAYLVIFKLTYIITSIIILVAFWKLDKSYERSKDTCSLIIIYLPCITAAILLTDEHTVIEVLWTLSRFLEAFAMVPQYIFCYRDQNPIRDYGVIIYVMSMGGYRMFYAANWIYKKLNMPNYSDVQSWLGGIIEIAFFVDYLLSQTIGFSVLRAMVLKVDEKINDITDKVEMKVLGSSRAMRQNNDTGCELRQRRPGKDEVVELPIDV
eukprot:gnl/TRDRNA2_/TRDRNA2_45194_c0_seq1.p1 gnl/TRDRNA2_/TRDRNA2_45194_c0~~gnl/TRDRNA2_/TRDRNA2_45194_c0_seq1.p1  ORF type:complete len:310 (+),score=59.47 gnl/TRDRNA2_/TRDRNA2_45194_c0_seq1:57-986(+)